MPLAKRVAFALRDGEAYTITLTSPPDAFDGATADLDEILGELELERVAGRYSATAIDPVAGSAAIAASMAAGERTCSITITAAPMTPARSASWLRTMRRWRVASGSERW